jgi:hypothetical protein
MTSLSHNRRVMQVGARFEGGVRMARGECGIAGATLAAALMMWVSSLALASGQAPPYKAPRTHDGKPDFTGIWQALNTANWDIEPHGAEPGPKPFGALFAIPPGMGVVDGGEIPYTPEALQKRRQNRQKRWADDPEVKCYLPGVPRFVYMPYPFQIAQGSDYIIMSSEYAAAARTLHLTTHKEALVDAWMGHSWARFDGESLVVEVTALNGEAWFDRAGNFASSHARIVERFTAVGPDRLAYEALIDDPTVFTRPWKMRMPLYRRAESDSQLLEFKCVEFAEDLLYGHLRRQPSK